MRIRRSGLIDLIADTIDEPCPDCGAAAGDPCVNGFTGHQTRVPHPSRLRTRQPANPHEAASVGPDWSDAA